MLQTNYWRKRFEKKWKTWTSKVYEGKKKKKKKKGEAV